METYKILGGLHRHGLQGEQEIELIMHDGEHKEENKQEGEDAEEGKDLENSGNKKKKRVLKFTDAQGLKTLDKPENLVLDANFDTEALVDPLFKQTTARFDEMSLGSLLTSCLSVNSDLLIQLDSQMPQLTDQEKTL